jgi:hypothetical protein
LMNFQTAVSQTSCFPNREVWEVSYSDTGASEIRIQWGWDDKNGRSWYFPLLRNDSVFR